MHRKSSGVTCFIAPEALVCASGNQRSSSERKQFVMTGRRDYLVFGQPLIEEPEVHEVIATMRAAWLGSGPKVAEFERRVAAYKGTRHAVAVNSCTAGLHLSCIALGLTAGDEVIVPALTFCATVN